MENAKNLIPLTITEKLILNCKEINSLATHKYRLPLELYYILQIFILSSLTIPALLPSSSLLWSSEPYTQNLLNIFSNIIRLGNVVDSAERIMINFGIFTSIYIILFTPIIILYIYKRNNINHTDVLLFLCVLCLEFFVVIISFYLPTTAATCIGIMINSNSYDNFALWCILVATLVLFYFNYFFILHIIFHQLTYSKGRTWAWSTKEEVYVYLFACLSLFFSRISELINNTYFLIPYILLFASLVFFLYLVLLSLPFISPIINSFVLGMCISSLVTSFLLVLFHFVSSVQSFLIVLIFFSFSIALTIAFSQMITKRMLKLCDNIESFEAGTIDFKTCCSNYRDLIRTVRAAFYLGSPALFSWKIFREALVEYPSNIGICFHWLKFLAIYPEQSQLFDEVLSYSENLNKGDNYMRQTIKEFAKVSLNREKSLSVDTRKTIYGLKRQMHSLKSKLSLFWKTIMSSCNSKCYSISVLCNKKIHKIDLQCRHAIFMKPNNSHLCLLYSQFLSDIVGDPQTAETWFKRSLLLKHSPYVINDKPQMDGMELFGKIPRSLKVDGEQLYEKTTEQSLKSSTSFSVTETETQFTDENLELSTIYNSGQNAIIPYMMEVKATIILFSIISLLGSIIAPIVVLYTDFVHLEEQTLIIREASFLALSISRLAYHISSSGMSNVNLTLTSEQLIEILHLTGTFYTNNEVILSEKSSLQLTYSNLINDIPSSSGLSNGAKSYFNDRYLDVMVFSDTENATRVNMTLAQATEVVVSSIESYSTSLSTFIELPWFRNLVYNAQNVSSAIIEFNDVVLESMSSLVSSNIEMATIIAICFLVCLFLITMICSYYVKKLRDYWFHVISTIRTIPRSVLQQTQSNFYANHVSDEKLTHFESVISNSISHVSLDDKEESFPMRTLIYSLIGLFVLTTLFVVTILVFINKSVNKLKEAPAIISLISLYSSKLFDTCLNVKKLVAISHASPLDTNSFDVTMSELESLFLLLDVTMTNILTLDVNGIKLGKLTSNGNFSGNMLFTGTVDFSQDQYNMLKTSPYVMSHGYLLELLDKICIRKTVNFTDIPLTEITQLLLTFTVSDFAYPSLFKPLLSYEGDLLNSEISYQKSFWLITCIAALLILFISSASLFLYILSIRNTFHFCLSQLAHVDNSHICSSSVILELLNGKITKSNETDEVSMMLKNANEITKEPIFLLNKFMKITWVNKAALDFVGLSNSDVINAEPSSMFTFLSDDLNECIEKFKNGDYPTNNDQQFVFQTSIIKNEERIDDFSVKITPILTDPVQFCITLLRDPELIQKKRDIEEEEKAIKNITDIIIPSDLKQYMSSSNDILIFNKLFLAIFKLNDLEAHLESQSTDEVIKWINRFKKVLNHSSKMFKNAAVVKELGLCIFVIFDISGPGYQNPENVLKFIKVVNQTIPEYNFSGAITNLRQFVAGRLSEQSTVFNIYSNEINHAFNLCINSPSGVILMNTNYYELVQSVVSNFVVNSTFSFNSQIYRGIYINRILL